MNSFFEESMFAGVTLSIIAYLIGAILKKKFKLGIFNPLLIAIVVSIVFLYVNVEPAVGHQKIPALEFCDRERLAAVCGIVRR